MYILEHNIQQNTYIVLLYINESRKKKKIYQRNRNNSPV